MLSSKNMNKRKKAAIQVAVLSILFGLVTWHVVHWHSTGMYLEMFRWLEAGKGYITVLYNLGVMLTLGTVLSFLMEKFTDLLGYEIHEIKHFDEDEAGERQ